MPRPAAGGRAARDPMHAAHEEEEEEFSRHECREESLREEERFQEPVPRARRQTPPVDDGWGGQSLGDALAPKAELES